MKKNFLLLTLFFLLNGSVVAATNNIFINEIQIEPDQSIEIINIGQESADISGWYLDDNGGSTYFTIPQNTTLPASSCLVFSSNFNLNKSSSDTARLFDSTAPPTSDLARLIDSHTYSSSPGPNLTFFLLTDYLSWTSGASTLGKFNTTDTNCIIIPTAMPSQSPSPMLSPTSIPTLTPSPTPTATPYTDIYISEVMTYPLSGDSEWVELYNNNDVPVFLMNWFIDDGENTGSVPKQFSLTIPSKSYAIYEFSSAIFNNNGDMVRLLDSNKNLKDSFEYSTSEQGKTLGRARLDSDTFCLQEASKTIHNKECIVTTISSSPITKITPFLTNPVEVGPAIQLKIPSSQPLNMVTKKKTFLQPKRGDMYPKAPINSEVLGRANSIKYKLVNNVASEALSLLSVCYSLLSAASIILKMKLSSNIG